MTSLPIPGMIPGRRFPALPCGPARGLARLPLALAAAAAVASAQAAHEHGADTPGARPPARVLGTVAFPNAGAPAAQAPLRRALAHQHNFHYREAREAFREASRADPGLALARWGEALTFTAPVWGLESLDSSHAALARLGATPEARLARARTADERAFGAAVEAFYTEGTLAERARRFATAARRWADARGAAAARAPQEAGAFAALALLVQAYTGADAEEGALLDTAAAYAERVLARNPRHPGAAHYLTHAYDRPDAARRGLAAARAYDRIAPDAEHALHMPSHIYHQLGMWGDMARSNERAWAASRASGQPDWHSLEWLQYAYLQQGRWSASRALVDTARRVLAAGPPPDALLSPDAAHAVAALAWRHGVESGDWSAWTPDLDAGIGADTLAGPGTSARARGMAMMRAYRSAHARLARASPASAAFGADTAAVSAAARRLATRSEGYRHALGAQLEARLALLRGDSAAARLALGRALAAYAEGGPAIPGAASSRELLAALDLAQGRVREAIAGYERALVATPLRSAALLGLARAQRAAGMSDAAARSEAAHARAASYRTSAQPSVQAPAPATSPAPGAMPWSDDDWIGAAVLALPPAMRAGAGVARLRPEGELELRPSRNGIVCFAATPGDTLFDMRCYQAPYAAAIRHVRRLRASGIASDSVVRRMDEDVRARRVPLPETPSAGYRMLGPLAAYDRATARAGAAIRAWQSLHVPFRTGADLGLPDAPRGTHPFVMAGGSWWSHVMIVHDALAARTP